MSKKWRSSKKVSVDGAAFTRARMAFKNTDEELIRGVYGSGSQEWLADQSRVSPRTVNELERGKATLKTVDAVSKVLSIKGRQYIQGYGEDFTTFRTTGVVDFRPGINGRLPENETAYMREIFLISLDPVMITVDDDFIETATLQQMKLNLSVGNMEIDFSWLYKIMLTGQSKTWLGDEEDVSEIAIKTREPYQASIMFRQDFLKSVSWKQFTDYIKVTDDGRILLTLKLVFEHFEKKGNIIVSVEELRGLLEKGFPHGCPYWVQPKALMV